MLEPHDCQLETPLEKDKKKSQKQAHDMWEKKKSTKYIVSDL